MRSFLPAVIAALASIATAGPLCAAETVVPTRSPPAALLPGLWAEWESYASRFVTPEGRVLDNANGNISHSEGQGYGLVLAAKAGDAARFETIRAWTAKTLLVRKDGLAAWKWEPSVRKVTDTNNATDGDILIAWGLAEGAKRFKRADYRQAAAAVARAVGTRALVLSKSGPLLLPGVKGFLAGEQKDGPVINLSYWVFPAFPVLKDLAPAVRWDALRLNGLALLKQSAFGALGLPTEWESLARSHPGPAAGFPATFGYNAIRIPLYLAMDGRDDSREALGRFAGPWARAAPPSPPADGQPAALSVPIDQPGYDVILALARCAATGQAIPPRMLSVRSDLYYPETLRLLSIIAIQERYQSCV